MALPQNANLIRHWHVNAGLYTDAGVTAAGVGDDVLQWHDVVTGHIASQPTLNTSCPTLQADGLHFDGDDWLEGAGIALGTGARTLIALVELNSFTAVHGVFSVNDVSSSVNSYGMFFWNTSIDRFGVAHGSSSTVTNFTPTLNTPYIASISAPNNGQFQDTKFYINGINQAYNTSNTPSSSYDTDGTGNLTIGALRLYDSFTRWWNGTIKAIAVWDVELSAAEIAAITETDLVPSPASGADVNTVLLIESIDETEGSVNFVDLSNNNYGLTPQRTITHSQDVGSPIGLGTSAIKANAAGYLETVDNFPDLLFNNFTIEMWVYLNSQSTCYVWGQNSAARVDLPFILETSTAPSGGWLARTYNGNAITWGDTRANNVGKWTHLAVERDGSVTRFYQDGVLRATQNHSTYIQAASETLTFGTAYKNSTNEFNGYLQQIRVSDVARYQGVNFTPPDTFFSAPTAPPNEFATTLPNLTSALTAHVGAPPVFDATLPALRSALRARFAPGGTDALFTTQLPALTGALEADTVSNAFDTELPALTASLTGFIPVPVLFNTRLPKMVSALRARQQQTSFDTILMPLSSNLEARTLGRNRLAEINSVLPALTSGLTGNVDYKAFNAELPMLTSALEALTSREVTLEVTWTAQTVKELAVTWQVGSLQKRVDLPVTWFAAEQAVKELAVTWEAFDPNQQPTITRLNLSSNGARQRWRGSMQSFDELFVGDTLIELDGLMIEANIKSVVRDYQGDGITRYSAEFEVLPLNRSGLNAIIGIHNAPDYVKQLVDEQDAPMSFWEAEYIRKTSRRYTAREYFSLAANRAGVTIIFDERLPGLDALLPFDAQWDGYGMSFADALNDVFGAMKPRIYSDAQGRIRVESSRRPASVGTLQNATTRTITRSQVEDVTIEATYYGGNAAHLDFISGAPLSYNRTIVQRKFDTDGVADGAEYLAQWWSAQGFESVPIEIYALKPVSNWWQTWVGNEVTYQTGAVDSVDAISTRAANFSRSKAALSDRRGALLETKKLRTLTVTWEAVPAEAKQLPPTIDGQRITELDVFWSAV